MKVSRESYSNATIQTLINISNIKKVSEFFYAFINISVSIHIKLFILQIKHPAICNMLLTQHMCMSIKINIPY